MVAEHGDRFQGPALRRGQWGQFVQQQRAESGGQSAGADPGGGRRRTVRRRVLAVRLEEERK